MQDDIQIVVIDDNEHALELLSDFLELEGYNTASFSNPHDSLDFMRKNKTDLILLDIMMPGIDGYSFADMLKKEKKLAEIPIIFVTAKVDDESILEGFKHGAVDYLKKPVNLQELKARVTVHSQLKIAKENLRKELDEKEKAKNEAKENRAFLKAIIQSSSDPIFTLDKNMRYVEFNNAYAEYFKAVHGTELKKGTKITDVLTKEQKNKWIEIYKTAFNGKNVRTNLRRNINNKIKYYDISVSPVIKDGSIIGLSEIFRDITDLKQNEQTINLQKDYLNKIIDSVAHPFYIVDTRNFKVVRANIAAQKDMGQITQNTRCYNFLMGRSKPCKGKCIIEEVIEKRKMASVEKKTTDANGNIKYYQIFAYPFFDKNKEVTQVIKSLIDITERKKAEIALEESERKYRTLFNRNNDAVLIVDINEDMLPGYFLEANDTACEILGYKRSELLKMTPFDLASETDKKLIPQRVKKVIKEKKVIYELEFKTKNAQNIPFEVKNVIFEYKNKTAMMIVARDITERKKMQRKLMDVIVETEEKERDRFAKDLHDGLGALLSSINMYLDLIARGKISQDEMPQAVADMKQFVTEAVISSKEIANNIVPSVLINFGLVAYIKSFIEKITGKNIINIDFEANIDDKKLNLTEKTVLYRTINELINNTLKYANAKNVKIRLCEKERFLTLYYQDDGIGFNFDKVIENTTKVTGINNIINRIKLLNGKSKILTSPGHGMKAIFKIKING